MSDSERSKTVNKELFGADTNYDYDNLLAYLRQLREEEAERVERVRKEKAASIRNEARPQNFLFEKEFVKGKGMRNGGYGGLIVGKHYKMKHLDFDMEAEQARNKKWMEDF